MFWSRNKKNRYTPVNISFTILKGGFKGLYITRICFPDVLWVLGGTHYKGMHANLINLYPFDGHNKVRSVLGSDESTNKNVNDIIFF